MTEKIDEIKIELEAILNAEFKTIDKIPFSKLRNYEFLQYCSDFDSIMKKSDLIKIWKGKVPNLETVEKLYAAFLLAHENLKDGLMVINKNKYTAQMSEADNLRDGIFADFRGYVLQT